MVYTCLNKILITHILRKINKEKLYHYHYHEYNVYLSNETVCDIIYLTPHLCYLIDLDVLSEAHKLAR